MRIRDLGYSPGVKPTGPKNTILDVPGVGLAQVTVPTDPENEKAAKEQGKPCAVKGLTVILPRPKDRCWLPSHAGTHIFNGNGELTGRAPIADWGFVNMPIVFTNSCSVGVCFDGAQDFMMDVQEKQGADLMAMARRYGTPNVGETADWWINSKLRQTRLSPEDVKRCFDQIKTGEEGGEVQEGSFGGGAGMMCNGYKGGTGTASRLVGGDFGGTEYTVGVLAQTNYGRQQDLQIGGVPIGRLLEKEGQRPPADVKKSETAQGRVEAGSLLVLIMTDAPLLPHQLDRLARHATLGASQVSGHGVGRTHSGDIFLAVSTSEHEGELLRGKDGKIGKTTETYPVNVVKNESIDAYFEAVGEATEEAILNSMVGSRNGMLACDGNFVDGLPVDRVKELLAKYLIVV
ncbi:peptidase family S58-domain-containing protein [Elsinoe ampelina]|uniref:Peptidase family S58-domain-containing protein n=1 Tax=Elsinoe ampelina TaxID=302913 RepID=A0A6A6GH09_9PEZI|nr:peptidase family S58-domain-containing protein [Elsinoe ampelina]